MTQECISRGFLKQDIAKFSPHRTAVNKGKFLKNIWNTTDNYIKNGYQQLYKNFVFGGKTISTSLNLCP